MLFANACLVAARIELALHRAKQIADINDARVPLHRFIEVLPFEVMVCVGVVVVAVPGQ